MYVRFSKIYTFFLREFYTENFFDKSGKMQNSQANFFLLPYANERMDQIWHAENCNTYLNIKHVRADKTLSICCTDIKFQSKQKPQMKSGYSPWN
jgi:hypothetical protein